MPKLTVDCRKNWRLLDEMLQQPRSAQQRQMLLQLKRHMQSETGGDLAVLMQTLIEEPVYHQWSAQGEDSGAKGRAAVTEFYEGLIASGSNQFEYDVQRIVVGDNCVVTEGDIKIPFSGEALLAMGQDVDAQQRYATQARCVTFWPFDENGKIIGEDIYTLGGFDFSQALPADVYEYRYAESANEVAIE